MAEQERTDAERIREIEEMEKEIERLRSRIWLLESELAAPDDREPQPRTPRKPFNADIEFIADFDILEAKGIDLSAGGVGFEVDGDLPFEMRFTAQGKEHHYRAHLIWAERLEEGGCRLGFKFVAPGTEPEF